MEGEVKLYKDHRVGYCHATETVTICLGHERRDYLKEQAAVEWVNKRIAAIDASPVTVQLMLQEQRVSLLTIILEIRNRFKKRKKD